jgi:hypothetical protein
MDDFNSRVGRTVKAYQGNPKALDKKYQMNKELADLIGLQTILSQQEAISRETMLRENQQVGNLREQYEQKLASNSQDGMAKSTTSYAPRYSWASSPTTGATASHASRTKTFHASRTKTSYGRRYSWATTP